MTGVLAPRLAHPRAMATMTALIVLTDHLPTPVLRANMAARPRMDPAAPEPRQAPAALARVPVLAAMDRDPPRHRCLAVLAVD